MREITGFYVVAPSTLAVNEEFTLRLKALCEPWSVGTAAFATVPAVRSPFNLSPRGIAYLDNVPAEWGGTVQIQAEGGYRGPDGFSFKDHHGPYRGDRRPIARLDGLSFSAPGLKRVAVVDPVSGVRGLSNPIAVTATPPAERLYWGDMHCQTYFSDGLRCPEELFAFARHEAFLDIFGLADHSEWITDRQWEYFVGVTNDCHDPEAFVTLIGQEWTSAQYGHRNLHFPGDSAPCVRSNHPTDGELDRLYAIARAEGALAIPHHSANVTMGVDWTRGHDPQVERLVEIASVWGSSERPAAAGNTRPLRVLGGEKQGQHVVDALRLGRRYGLVGGGDTHDGRPGDELHSRQELPEDYRKLWRQGIMGVWARELTRESVFAALWNRRVFATTNVRTLVRFSVCGQPMGSEVRHRGVRPLALQVAGQSPLARVDLVRNGEDLITLYPDGDSLDYRAEDGGTGGTDYYYARITHTNGDLAWSSPVWVEEGGAKG